LDGIGLATNKVESIRKSPDDPKPLCASTSNISFELDFAAAAKVIPKVDLAHPRVQAH
jgi:hypothetical protein